MTPRQSAVMACSREDLLTLVRFALEHGDGAIEDAALRVQVALDGGLDETVARTRADLTELGFDDKED